MNQIAKYFYPLVVLSLLSASCTREEALDPSRITTEKVSKTPLDLLIDEKFRNPYNIEVYYRWNQYMVDLNRYMYPPQIEKVKPALEIVEKIWLNSYKTVAGEDFIKLIKPGELLLVGGINLNKTGTIVLGVADAGMRITLFQTDYVDENDPKSVKKFIHTIQHEYIHILNQNKDFKQKEYGSITSEGYTSNWHEFTDMDSRELGYITSYARANVIEDFAEMASFMLVYSKSEYKEVLDRISNKKAVNSLKDKERFVVRYFREAHGIDFYALWEAAEQNTNEIINEKTS